MPETENYEQQAMSLLEHPRLRQSMYLHCGPEHAFWELIHGWGMLMDFACRGITWDHPAKIEIEVGFGVCTIDVEGGASAERVFRFLNKTSTCIGKEELPVEFPSSVFGGGGRYTQDAIPEMPHYLPLMLIIAYSQEVRIMAVQCGLCLDMSISKDRITEFARCIPEGASEEDSCPDHWRLEFKPNPQYIAEMSVGSAFRAECFRRACAYSEALTICVEDHKMHEFRGTRTWMNLVAPYPYWQKSVNVRLFVPGRYEFSYSLRPGSDRTCVVFAAGHLSGGQPQTIFEQAFEEFIVEAYGQDALAKYKEIGFIAVLSILNLNDIMRPSMASDDCYIDPESALYQEIRSSIKRTLCEHDLKEIGIV